MENNVNQSQELDFRELVQIVFKRFWLISILAAVGVIAALLINTFMRPAYRATALLMINQENAGKIGSRIAHPRDYHRKQHKRNTGYGVKHT